MKGKSNKSYIAVNLENCHCEAISGGNLSEAKTNIATHHPTQAWAVIPRAVFDKGIVLIQKEESHVDAK